MKGISGPVLADVAANVLVVTLVVLIALGRMAFSPPAPSETPLAATPVTPIGGAEAVELLRQRLLPDTNGLVDVGANQTAPNTPVRVLYILDPSAYPATQGQLMSGDPDWLELTVPEALKTRDNRWHPDFLALASIADQPDRFQIGLQELLARRMGARGNTAVMGGEAGSSLRLRFAGWFWAALDLVGLAALLAAFWALLRLRRWARAV